jgi:transcriptional regulator with XRE-family HTH domain
MNVNGEQLTKRREGLGLTRDELARELKTTYTTIYRWETANREIPPYLELAIERIEIKFGENKKD